MKRTIVISAVNIRKGGTLTILRNCLEYLSSRIKDGHIRVVALVHKRELCDYPGIEYIEYPDCIKSWFRRLWCEYVTMNSISKRLAPVYIWLSLHDTTPRVKADIQAVYCQTSFPFLKLKTKDFLFDYKIVLFSLFTRFAYQINIRRNKYLVVQTEWLRKGFSEMCGIDPQRFIVAPPQYMVPQAVARKDLRMNCYTFLFAATPDCHKNFECLCRAALELEQEIGKQRFKVILTIKGDENRYARYLSRKYGSVSSITFAGFMSKEILYAHYEQVDCMVYPSRIETWGLPITEFSHTKKPLLLADLPYAHETAAGCHNVAFFDISNSTDLKDKMKMLVERNNSCLQNVKQSTINEPVAYTWEAIFDQLQYL